MVQRHIIRERKTVWFLTVDMGMHRRHAQCLILMVMEMGVVRKKVTSAECFLLV